MIDDLYIVNYYHPGSEPLKSITQLSKTEAFHVAERLYSNSQCRAHKRFGPDFPEYYKHRLITEQWLYQQFKDMGGNPQTEHPYYFVLQYSDVFYTNFDNGNKVEIALDSIDKSDISFTFGDSMAVMYREDRKTPFLKDELFDHIKRFDTIDKFLDSIKEQYVCIEAQLWTDKYFSK